MTDSEDISATCFVPLQKSLIENATMAKMYCNAYPLGTAKRVSSPLSAPVSLAPGPWASCSLLFSEFG
jgi:hypothetical protein